MSNQAWGRYQDALAADVTDETWRYLATAYDGIRQFNEAAAHGRALTKGVGVNFSSAGLREGFVNVHQAMTCLERDLPGSKAGIHHYTGYASADDMWPVGSLSFLTARQEPLADMGPPGRYRLPNIALGPLSIRTERRGPRRPTPIAPRSRFVALTADLPTLRCTPPIRLRRWNRSLTSRWSCRHPRPSCNCRRGCCPAS